MKTECPTATPRAGRPYMMPFVKRVVAFACDHSCYAAAREFGISRTAIHRWRVNLHGPIGTRLKRRILAHLRLHGPSSAPEIREALGVRSTDVTGALRTYTARGIVVRVSGTRRSYRYAIPNTANSAASQDTA